MEPLVLSLLAALVMAAVALAILPGGRPPKILEGLASPALADGGNGLLPERSPTPELAPPLAAPPTLARYNRRLSGPLVTVVIPTLDASEHLRECVRSLENQCRKDFETIVVDNSGRGLARPRTEGHNLGLRLRVIENPRNVGFGAAINQGRARKPCTVYSGVER